MTWREVPEGYVHGILQGYRVFYSEMTADRNISYVNVSTDPENRQLHVTGLKRFTKYSVKVLAFTRKGDGAVSTNISVLTDEDGNYHSIVVNRMTPHASTLTIYRRPSQLKRKLLHTTIIIIEYLSYKLKAYENI